MLSISLRGGFFLPFLLFLLIFNSGCRKKGCTDVNASNYDPKAKINQGCEYIGCTDPFAVNYNPHALVNDGCQYASNATFKVTLRPFVNGVPFVYNSTYTYSGRNFSINLLRYYLSGITLHRSSGEVSFPNTYILAGANDSSFLVGNVIPGTFDGISFAYGVDSITNQKTPSDFPNAHPLGSNNSSMFWTSWFGYVFLKLEGVVDATNVPDGSMESTLSFHLGSDDLLREIYIPYSGQVGNNGTADLDIRFDLIRLLDNLDLSVEKFTHTTDDLPLATKVADNVPNAFSKSP